MRPGTAIAAVVIVAAAAGAILATPAAPAALNAAPEWRRPAGGGETAPPAPAPAPVLRPEYRVLEQPTPIVGADGRLSEALGIEISGGQVMVLIAKGTPVPAVRLLPTETNTDDQAELRFHVLRGSSPRADQNHSLGWVRVTGLAPWSSGAVRATVLFAVQKDAIAVAAVDPASGKAIPIEPSAPWGAN